jgi:hypothetical protein
MDETYFYCPDCGGRTAILLENCEPDSLGEYKQSCNCDRCDTLFYIVRNVCGAETPNLDDYGDPSVDLDPDHFGASLEDH